MKKKIVKKPTLTAEEKYWQQAEDASKELIDHCFNRNLPIEYAPKNLDLEKSTDWRIIARDDVPSFYEEAEQLPDIEHLAQQISYHYLLTILKRFIDDLREYYGHDESYLQSLIQE